jgi:hypothetical protein
MIQIDYETKPVDEIKSQLVKHDNIIVTCFFFFLRNAMPFSLPYMESFSPV